jgi:uncharacterized membrane-anchored protein
MLDASIDTADDFFLTTPQEGKTWPISKGFELWLVIGVVVVQVVVLVSMIVTDAAPLVFGERIKLQTAPVDPRDLFRGDYVVLEYDFNRFGSDRVRGLPDSRDYGSFYNEVEGRDVYVSLTPKGDHYEASGAAIDRPSSGPYLRGRMVGPNRLECGIEAYYVEEGEGRRLENLMRQRRLLAEVAVWRGQAKLVRLIE